MIRKQDRAQVKRLRRRLRNVQNSLTYTAQTEREAICEYSDHIHPLSAAADKYVAAKSNYLFWWGAE